MAQDKRLLAMITAGQEQARLEFERTKAPARVFADLARLSPLILRC